MPARPVGPVNYGLYNADDGQMDIEPMRPGENAYTYSKRREEELRLKKQKTQEQLENLFSYGGKAGLAEERAGQYGGIADDAANGRTMQDTQAAMGLQRDAALGKAPSAAERLANLQGDKAAAQQSSLLASARGPAAMALAQQQAMGNAAATQSDIAGKAFVGRAQEMESARNSYANTASGYNQAQFGQRMAAMGQQDKLVAAQGLGKAGAYQATKADTMRGYADRSGKVAAENAADNAREQAVIGGITGLFGGAASLAAMASDATVKQNMTPLDSYSGVDTKDFVPFGGVEGLSGIDAIGGHLADIYRLQKSKDDHATFQKREQKLAGLKEQEEILKKQDLDSAKSYMPATKPAVKAKTASEKIYEDQKAEQKKLEMARGIGALAQGGTALIGGVLSPDKSSQYAYAARRAEEDMGRANMLEQMAAQAMLSDVTTKKSMKPMGDAEAAALSKKADAMFGGKPRISDAEASKLSSQADAMFGLASNSKKEKAPDTDKLDKSVANTLMALQAFKSPLAEKAQHGDKMAEYLSANKGAEYTYKPEMQAMGAPGGKQFGPASAQQIASTEIGSGVIKREPMSGKLAIDGQQALKAGMAADNYLAENQAAQDKKLDMITHALFALRGRR